MSQDCGMRSLFVPCRQVVVDEVALGLATFLRLRKSRVAAIILHIDMKGTVLCWSCSKLALLCDDLDRFDSRGLCPAHQRPYLLLHLNVRNVETRTSQPSNTDLTKY
jgi:hypothetical protein